MWYPCFLFQRKFCASELLTDVSSTHHGVHSFGRPWHLDILHFHPIPSVPYSTDWPILWGVSRNILCKRDDELWTSCDPLRHGPELCSALLYARPAAMYCVCCRSSLLLGVWRRHPYSWRLRCSNYILVGFRWVSKHLSFISMCKCRTLCEITFTNIATILFVHTRIILEL